MLLHNVRGIACTDGCGVLVRGEGNDDFFSPRRCDGAMMELAWSCLEDTHPCHVDNGARRSWWEKRVRRTGGT